MSITHQTLSFLKYWMHQVDRHSLHSPFLFNLNNQIFKSPSLYQDGDLEEVRRTLLADQTLIETTTFGANSREKTLTRTIANIAKIGITQPKYSWLISGMCEILNPNISIELGTSIGLNTLYLARNSNEVISFEGCVNTLNFAKNLSTRQRVNNIEFIEGNIDSTLTDRMKSVNKVDFAFVDANHRYEPTLNYFENIVAKAHRGTALVFDDIHWSKEMSHAWKDIYKDKRVTLSLDLFQVGLVFLDRSLTKEHYCITF